MSVMKILLAGAVAAAASASLPSFAAEPLPSTQVAERTANDQFEFRSRTNVWRFGPDGRVDAAYTASRMVLGGIGENFGMRAQGAWRRDGDRICIEWQQGRPAPNGCYTIVKGNGSMVVLTGPGSIEGALEASGPAPVNGIAEKPAPRPRGFGR